MSEAQCDCANMNGYMCYPCLEKDYYAISADNFRLIHENKRLRAELNDVDDDFHALKAMFDKMRADVKRWHTIATNLIHGAEQQIDEFREPWDKSTNEAWLGAWHDYHQAVLDEGAKL